MIPASVLGLRAGAGPGVGEALAPEDLSTPLPARRVFVPGPDLCVNCMDSGGDGLPVVLIHGLSCTMGFWQRQVPALVEAGHRVLALDLPGFGHSDKPDVSYSPGWYASVVSAWLAVLGVRRFVLVGHSMGGQIALHLVLQARSRSPDRVIGLVLAAPAGVETFRPEAARWMMDYWTEARALNTPADEIRANFTQLVFNRVDEGVLRLLDERLRLQRHPSFREVSRAVSRAVRGMLEQPVFDRLGEIRAPTLLVFGDADRLIPNPVFNPGSSVAVAERGAAAIPGAELVVLAGAGHMVQHDDPSGMNAALCSFLERRLSAETEQKRV